jgi:hypothetical protein
VTSAPKSTSFLLKRPHLPHQHRIYISTPLNHAPANLTRSSILIRISIVRTVDAGTIILLQHRDHFPFLFPIHTTITTRRLTLRVTLPLERREQQPRYFYLMTLATRSLIIRTTSLLPRPSRPKPWLPSTNTPLAHLAQFSPVAQHISELM